MSPACHCRRWQRRFECLKIYLHVIIAYSMSCKDSILILTICSEPLQEMAEKLTLLKRVHCDIGGFDALHAGPFHRNCSIVLQRQLPGHSAYIAREYHGEREYYKDTYMCVCVRARERVNGLVDVLRARIYRDLCGSGKRPRTVMLS